MIRFDQVTKRYPDGTVAVDDLEPGGADRPDHRPGRSLRLRQDHVAADDQPDDRADRAARSGSTTPTPPAWPTHELRRQIGYVIQHAGLFPHRTIVDNVATVPFLLGTDKKQARARAMELIERVGLDPAVRQALPGAALRRPAAARRASPARWPPTRR